MCKKYFYFIFCFIFFNTNAQTTDLSIVVEARNASGVSVSQVDINQNFEYLITILNSGATVNNATFQQVLNTNVSYFNAISQNNSGGSSDVINLNYSNNTLSGTITNMPNNSSVEVLVTVKAPIIPGGIATNVTVEAPNGVTDNNTTNNQSIISIDISDVPIDFTVTHSQISPSENTAISMWNTPVTYQTTITNNSSIAFPIDGFYATLAPNQNSDYGSVVAEFISLTCLNGTNNLDCPDVSSVQGGGIQTINFPNQMFAFSEPIEFPVGASLTFEFVYNYLEPICGLEVTSLDVDSIITIELEHENESSIDSNIVITQLLESTSCEYTDLCINTIQTNPPIGQIIEWGEEVTFVTTACNNGPNEALTRFNLQNLSPGVQWEIQSVDCNSTTGAITCDDFNFDLVGSYWSTNDFIMPVNSTIEVITVIVFLEPECILEEDSENAIGYVKSVINLLSTILIESDANNNVDNDSQILPPFVECDPEDLVDLEITKTQISPELPQGSTETNTAEWGEVTYEIIASNYSDNDAQVEIIDFMPDGLVFNSQITGALVSVECVSTTGNANCLPIPNTNIGVFLDGDEVNGEQDVFWSILYEDNWVLPANSSLTFHAIIDWLPECSQEAILSRNKVSIQTMDYTDTYLSNNYAFSDTYFAPCVDLVVQTYPEFSQVNVNQVFNWIIEITNSNTSSNAINIDFQDVLDSEFTITGMPSCNVLFGNATCPLFTISENTISGNIESMDSASTLQILIPVTAPNLGGAFTNSAQAIPNPDDNEELTPETNISINNVQVISPLLIKTFIPDEITVNEQSILEFTISNLQGNPEQSDIDFTDNLPDGVVISGSAYWLEQNGCTANFNTNIGDTAITVSNLMFPEGIAYCTFAVPVTSSIAGNYLNNSSNFNEENNIDVSSASATLNVLEDTTNVDVAISKDVNPIESGIGTNVVFTINVQNEGTTTAHDILILESLPIGYSFISSNASAGAYDENSFLWSIPSLSPNQMETLMIVAKVIATSNLLNVASLESVLEIDQNNTNNEDFAEIIVNNCLIIPQGISPNEDGINDVFEVPCIEDYQDNNIKIYNRYGSLVFETNNYNNNWDGIANRGDFKTNKTLPTGTYFYVLKVKTIKKPFTGWLYLNY